MAGCLLKTFIDTVLVTLLLYICDIWNVELLILEHVTVDTNANPRTLLALLQSGCEWSVESSACLQC